MKLLLAPMEGVVDYILRDTLTEIGGIDQCVTEFMRVVDLLHPDHLFYKFCPELRTHSRTRAGTPVYFQILGGKPAPMAENALKAARLGAAGIDINFGCPAKIVNKNDGGAALLKFPSRIYDIVKAVRKAVPAEIPVTVKIRLGFDDRSQCLENAKAAAEAGAHFLTVHCRTKVDGYKPPAYWEWIPQIRELIKIPIIANGDVSTVADYHRCREISGSEDVMIGRGAISNPFLFRQIKEDLILQTHQLKTWDEMKVMLPRFYLRNEEKFTPYYARAKTIQWLRAMAVQSEKAKTVFDELKLINEPQNFSDRIASL